ncbi:RNA-directed DNA polymerase, eukaryota [Tanacetum coccineum]
MIDGIWSDSPFMVKREFLHHFRTRFDKPEVSRAALDMVYPKTLSVEQQVDLEMEVSKEEIKRTVWDCGVDKSPGPDGFTFGFYRRFWKVIENDVFEAVKYFFTYGDIPKGCNSSFIALIPKIPDANSVKDFRPISLIGSLYKIIEKILANRLVSVLGDIVNEVQSAFIADRQILDGPFILNEVLQWCKSKKKQSLIFKVDFEKAYDSVRWDFLDDVLNFFGFGGKWCNWIQSCLKSSRGSIIINGSPTEEFQFYKGSKQGDPLALFLFILIMESLHLSFQRVVDAGMFKGITLKPSLNLSHMFYADDAIFVGQWCDGSKVGGSMTRVKAWKEVVDRVNARLSKWKMTTLSIGGSKKTSWVKWKNALASKEKGGLGVSSLYALNIGLMFKWVWRFFTQHKSLWVRVIKAIHGEDGKVGKQVKSKSSSYWMDIVNELTVLENKDVALKNLYPRIYALESCKYVTVGSKLAQSSLEYSFPRNPRGGIEQQQYESLLVQVHDVNLVPLSDRRIWSLESSGDFSVASVRKVIDDKMLPYITTKTRWIKSVPIKVNVHAWKVKIDSLPTRLNISRRGMDIDNIMCFICDNGVESSRHLFFTCHLVIDIIRKITRWWDITYIDVESYEEWLNWLVNLRLSSKHKQLLEGVFYVMWWHLWSYRNKNIFDLKTPSRAMIFEDIVFQTFNWCRYRCKASFSWTDWLKNPYLVSM